MKKMKKLLAVIAALSLLMTQFAGLNVFASNNWVEYYLDFDAHELGNIPAWGGNIAPMWFGGGSSTTLEAVADPAGEAGNTVLCFTNPGNSLNNACIGFNDAYYKGFKTVLSFKLYFPAENTRFRAWHDQDAISSASIVKEIFATSTSDAALIDATSYGQTLKYPAGHEKAGETYVPPVGEWFEVVAVIDNSTAGKIYAETWVDGVCMLPNTLVYEGDFLSNSWKNNLRLMSLSGSFYIDEMEDRRGDFDIMKAAPTASIDDSHTGDTVAIDATTATVSFDSATKRLMDTNTYSDAISITRGAFELEEGKDYTIDNKTHSSFDITFADTLKYGSEYTIALSDAAENLIGVSSVPATFTFKTEVNPNAENENPEIAINGAKDGVRYDIGSDITFNVVADDADGIAEIGLMVNDELVDFAESANAEFTLENLEEGIYTVYAYAIDASEEALTSNSESVELIVCDNTDTEINLSVADGEIIRIGGQKPFEASAYDADGEAISDVVLTLDGAVLGNALTVPTVGTHTLAASVTDSNGNEYTKEVGFEYRPEFYASGNPVIWDYSTSVPTLSGGDALKGELAEIDAEHGTSYVVTASESTVGNVKTSEDLWSYYHDGWYTEFEFYVDNVDAFSITPPFSNNANHVVTFSGGNIVDNDGNVYGTYEADKWYTVRVLYDSVAGWTYVDFGGVSLSFHTGKVGLTRPNYYNMIKVNSGYDGAKAAVDNVKTQYIQKYVKLNSVKATDANGVVSTAGAFLPTSTKSLELVFDMPIKDWCCHPDLMKLYKNSVSAENEIACTVAVGEVWMKGSYTCYRSAILTPSADFEEGQKYIVVTNPGIAGTTVYGTTYSSTFWANLVGYQFDFVASSGLEFDSVSILDDGEAVERIADIKSGAVAAELKVSNYSANDTTVDLIIASYNGNALSAIKIATQDVLAGNTATITTEEISTNGATMVKAFVWNGATDVVPYAPAKVIK